MPPESSCANLPAHFSRWTSASFSCTDPVALGLGHAAQLEAEGHVLGDRTPGQERELLEHHGDALHAQPAQGARVAARDVDRGALVVDLDRAAHDLVEAVDGAQQGRLARAREPHQHADLAALDGQRAAGHAQHLAGLGQDLLAGEALLDQRQRDLGLVAEDDVDGLEGDGGHGLSPPHWRRGAGRGGRA